MDEKLELDEPFVGDAYSAVRLKEIPYTLREAAAALKGSAFLKEAFGEDVVNHYTHTAHWEQIEYDRRVTDWELYRGFERY
ncbi:glutamine synthetase domain protein [Brucella abortus]|nr:glutamine synthetase domain protein [Brucella abortus]